MQDNSSSNKRIAKNTFMLYLRMMLTMVIGLYTSRIVLQTLGFSDYGLYNVVGGFVSMFGVLNHTLASGTQRFLSMALGKNDENRLKDVFANAITLHLGLAIIILVFGEIIGTWFVYTQMNVEPDRVNAALWVFQFSLMASLVQIIQVPFMSALIAHEKMNIYAYISVFDVTMKLLIVYLIQKSPIDKLILYAFLIFVVHLMSASLYNYYARRHYVECLFKVGWNKATIKEMTSFSGWIVIGMSAATFQGQGVNVLLNLIFNSVVNAARGIAFQVGNIIQQFSNNFLTAVNPQIIKTYANHDKEQCFKLVFWASKIAVILLVIIMMPLFVDIEYVLTLWLGKYPSFTPSFVRLAFIQSILTASIRPVIILTHAIGKMKMPNLVGGSVVLLAIPFAYITYLCGGGPVSVFAASVVPWIFENLSDLYFARRYAGFPLFRFYVDVQLKLIAISFFLYLIITKAYTWLHYVHWINFLIMTIGGCLVTMIVFFYVGLDAKMRKEVISKIKSATIYKI